MAFRQHWPWFAMFAAVLVISACVLASSPYTRGTDQFWYVADVDSLVHGQHTTNNVYPANLATTGPIPGHFVHNNLALYLVVPAAALFGAHWGWLVTNLLCTLGTALIVFLCVRSVSLRAATLVAALFLVLPLTVWLTSNTLSEPVYSFLTALCMYVWLRPEGPPAVFDYLLLTIAALAAALSKDNLTLLLLLPLSGIWLLRAQKRTRLGPALFVAGVFIIGVIAWTVLRARVFVENVNFSLAARLVTSAPPANDNMAPYFLSSNPAFDWTLLREKVAHNALGLVRFAPVEAPFMLPFLLLVLAFLWYAVRNRGIISGTSRQARACLFTIVLLASYLATVLLFQNESRYTEFVIPSLLVSVALFVRWTEWRLRVVAAGLVCMVPLAALMAVHIRKDGVRHNTEIAGIQHCIDTHLQQRSPLLVLRDPGDGSRVIEAAYAVRPRTAVFIEQPTFCEQLRRYRERLDVRYAFGRNSLLSPKATHLADAGPDAGRYADYGLYDIQSSCP